MSPLNAIPITLKVDPEGNQLPYIDTYAQELATDNEVLVLKALNGELDWQEQWITAPKNKSVFYDSQEKGNFHLFDMTPTTVNSLNIMFNMNCTDPVMKEIARNKDFRVGFSHAIDRQDYRRCFPQPGSRCSNFTPSRIEILSRAIGDTIS